MERWHIIFTGKVQGVFFRDKSSTHAKKLNLTGFVKNLPDGSVEAEAQGTSEDLHTWLKWCNSEEGSGHIEEISTTQIDPQPNEKTFKVIY